MCAKRHLNTRQIIIPLSGDTELGFTKHGSAIAPFMTGHHVSEINPWHCHQISWSTETHQEWVVCVGLDKEDKIEVPCRSWSKGWLVMLSKQPCPSTGCRHKQESKGRKGCCWGDGSAQVVPLPNTSHCEITDWTVKTLAEQSPKDTGAVDYEIRSARQLTNF